MYEPIIAVSQSTAAKYRFYTIKIVSELAKNPSAIEKMTSVKGKLLPSCLKCPLIKAIIMLAEVNTVPNTIK
jgi:hypothetical protein